MRIEKRCNACRLNLPTLRATWTRGKITSDCTRRFSGSRRQKCDLFSGLFLPFPTRRAWLSSKRSSSVLMILNGEPDGDKRSLNVQQDSQTYRHRSYDSGDRNAGVV